MLPGVGKGACTINGIVQTWCHIKIVMVQIKSDAYTACLSLKIDTAILPFCGKSFEDMS